MLRGIGYVVADRGDKDAVTFPGIVPGLSRLALVSGASGKHQCGFRTLSVIASARVSAAREGLLRG